jgi:CHASE3 domain sensor protein
LVTSLDDEVRHSAGLIRDMADQNARLIERVEQARRTLRRVLVIGSVWLALLSIVAVTHLSA